VALRGRFGGNVALLALVLALTPASAQAATINVNTELDPPLAPVDRCSLRSALLASSQDSAQAGCTAGAPGHDTIVVPSGLYGLNSVLEIRGDVTIQGAGAAGTVISQGATDRVMWVPFHSPAYNVTLDGLTITGGHAINGADGPDVSKPMAQPGTDGEGASGGNGMQGASGGGVFNEGFGTLTLLNARVTGNSAGSGGDGGNGTGGTGGFSTGSGLAGMGGVGLGGPGGFGGDGGGIYSGGPLVVRDSTLTGNLAGDGGAAGKGSGGWGGTSSNSLQARPGAAGTGGAGGEGGEGGAIYGQGAVTIERSVISANRAGAGATGGDGQGGIGGSGGSTAGTGGAGGTATGGSGGVGGRGGAITASGTLTLVSATISGNASGAGGPAGGARGGAGGAGSNDSGTGWFGGDATGGAGGPGGDGGGTYAPSLNATKTLYFDNDSGNGGSGGFGEGGVGGQSGFNGGHGNTGGTGTGGPGGNGGRGAAATNSGTSKVADTTITQNGGGSGGAGGGGLGGQGGRTNNAQQGGVGGNGNGANGGSGGAGGMTLPAGTLNVVHATISSNAGGSAGGAGTGTAGQGGLGGTIPGAAGASSNGSSGSSAPGGLHNLGGTLSLANSIVASNTPSNCAGTFGDGGHNIRFPGGACPGAAADPLLAALADNGGLTRTQALGGGSPALDLVPATGAGCTGTDQRGVSRPRGGGCDAGAYEKAGPDVTTGDAGAVSGTAATVAGSVTPNASSASYHFEYGTTSAYGSSTASQATGGVVPVPVSAALGGLAPSTTYHYRLVATSADGSAAGADRTLTTASDGTAPRFLSASIRPRVFAVNGKGARETPVVAVARGTTFRFALSEDARVVFTIHRVAPGRRVGGRCVKQTARNRSKRACKRYVKPRRFAANAKAGANRKRFSGRIGRRALAPGSYRATLVGSDAAGNASKAKRLNFRVVRAR
jgi:hypothetical protein